MKQIRIIVTALILGASLMAFTKAHQQTNDDKKTWYYKLDVDDEVEYNNAANYQDSPIQQFPSCDAQADDVLCSIRAEGNGSNQPLLDPNIHVTKDGTAYNQTQRDFAE